LPQAKSFSGAAQAAAAVCLGEVFAAQRLALLLLEEHRPMVAGYARVVTSASVATFSHHQL
jgi:hypothetical protein